MLLWSKHFQTLRPVKGFPMLNVVASEIQTAPSYHYEGRLRKNETHYLFKYTLEGEGCFRDGRGEWRVPAEHGFLCRINNPATAYYYPSEGKAPWMFVYATFSGDACGEMVDGLVERSGPVFKIPSEHDAVRGLMDARRLDEGECVIGAVKGASLVLELLLALGRAMESLPGTASGGDLAAKAGRIVAENLGEDLDVGDLAKEMGLTREHFTRRFAAETGLPPRRYILKRKMLAACRMLKEGHLSCKEVSAALGYCDPARFTRLFKGFIGMTPGAFKAHGEMPQV